MPPSIKKSSAPSPPNHKSKDEQVSNQPLVSAEAALSFLKDTKGVVNWTVRDLGEALKISQGEAEKVVALLEAQGYVAREGKSDWMTTAAGESVSGAKAPRLSRERVETAITEFKSRIAQINSSRGAPYRIDVAVAFGDFLLTDRPKAQPADVGVRLVSRQASGEPRSATSAKHEQAFLKELRGKTQMLTLRPYAAWMSMRTHQNLL
jgi:hypothetical protein